MLVSIDSHLSKCPCLLIAYHRLAHIEGAEMQQETGTVTPLLFHPRSLGRNYHGREAEISITSPSLLTLRGIARMIGFFLSLLMNHGVGKRAWSMSGGARHGVTTSILQFHYHALNATLITSSPQFLRNGVSGQSTPMCTGEKARR